METILIHILWSDNIYLHKISVRSKGNGARAFYSFNEIDHILTVASTSIPIGSGDRVGFRLKAVDRVGESYCEGSFVLHHYSELQETSTSKISLRQLIIDRCEAICMDYSIPTTEITKISAMQWFQFLLGLGGESIH